MNSCFGILALLLFLGLESSADETQLPLIDVFVGGQDGFPIYRIPSVEISKKGTLLAFAEARASKRDHAKNKIVLKRSSDHGRTWDKLQVIGDAGAECLNNPTSVVDRENGRIILMYQRYPEMFDEKTVVEGLAGDRICRTFVIRSQDDGLNWSAPQEVTASVKRPIGATSLASGPGVGIQLARGTHAGRILIPFNQGPYGHWQVYAAYSDDHGETWHYGNLAPEDAFTGANETQLVELTDGTVMLNARHQVGTHQRRISRSTDGGETWSPLADDPVLIEPRCQASLIRHSVDNHRTNDVLIFSNPATTFARTNGAIRLSLDEGQHWTDAKIIYAGSFAYSCLVSLDTQTVGCLFERDNYAKISFTSVALRSFRQ